MPHMPTWPSCDHESSNPQNSVCLHNLKLGWNRWKCWKVLQCVISLKSIQIVLYCSLYSGRFATTTARTGVLASEFQWSIIKPYVSICAMLGLCRAYVGSMLVPWWLYVGPMLRHVEPCWPMLGLCWGMLGHVGLMLGPCWAYVEPSWAMLGLCWGYVGPMLCWAHLGPCWAQIWQLSQFHDLLKNVEKNPRF